MPFVESLVATLIGSLVSLGLAKGVSTKTQPDGSVQVLKDNQPVTTIPKQIDVRGDPLIFGIVDVNRVLTSNTSKPAGADIEFTNPFKSKPIRVLSLGFIPDANFKTNGIFEVLINGRTLVKSASAGVYTDSDGINVPVPESGIILNGGEKIEIFAWGSSGTNGLTAQVMMGEF